MLKPLKNRNTQFRHQILLLGLAVMLGITTVQAQTIDYDLNQATRTLKDVGSGLERLRPGDIAAYNRLSAKLNKAAGHLETTQSKAHPDYKVALQRWGELQAQMVAIGGQLQAAQQQAAAAELQAQQQAAAAKQQAQQQAAAAELQAQQQAPAAKQQVQQQAPAAEQQAQQQAAAPQPTPAVTTPTVEAVNLDPLMTKYERQSLPKFPDDATPDQAREWALHMLGLQTTTLQTDLATIDSALSSGAASQSDADRVRRWISDQFQDNIQQTVQQQIQRNEGSISSIGSMADMINAVADGDMNGAYRFAGDYRFENSAKLLDNALRAGAVAAVFDDVFGTSDATRSDQVRNIQAARTRLDEFVPLAAKQEEAWATASKKKEPVAKDFLAPIAQKYWLNGSVMAESDDEGGIWIDSNNVGDITHSGEIWVQANERGSIEPNGDVWFDGNEVGSLEPNGEVWRGGSQVGLIDKNGKVWINGSADGEIVPLQGEWKRAAILYYFREFFAQ